MTQHNTIKLFEAKKVRTIWDDKDEKWYFSIVDVVAVLTDSPNPRKYWSVLKTRLKKEGSELTTNCSQLKMQAADGKKDVFNRCGRYSAASPFDSVYSIAQSRTVQAMDGTSGD